MASSSKEEEQQQKVYAIATITRGTVLEERSNGFFTANYDASGSSKQQLWVLEQGSSPKTFAIRNVGSGKYIGAAGSADYGNIQSDKKSWWTLEDGDSPGAYWIKCVEYNNYICNGYAKQNANNKCWMWTSNPNGYKAALQWYVRDAKASASPFSDEEHSEATDKKQEEIEEKEKALAEREKKLEEKEKDAGEWEAATKKQEEDLKAKEAALKAREQAISDREADAKDGEDSNEAVDAIGVTQDRKLPTREPEPDGGENEDTGKSQSSPSSDEVAKLQQRIQYLEKELAKAQRNPSPTIDRSKPIEVGHGFTLIPRRDGSSEPSREPSGDAMRKMSNLKKSPNQEEMREMSNLKLSPDQDEMRQMSNLTLSPNQDEMRKMSNLKLSPNQDEMRQRSNLKLSPNQDEMRKMSGLKTEPSGDVLKARSKLELVQFIRDHAQPGQVRQEA